MYKGKFEEIFPTWEIFHRKNVQLRKYFLCEKLLRLEIFPTEETISGNISLHQNDLGLGNVHMQVTLHILLKMFNREGIYIVIFEANYIFWEAK